MKKLIKYLYYSAALALLLTVSSAAYIDPSAMTYIIQIIAGVAIAAGAAFGFYWRRIKRFFTKNKDYGMDDYSLPDSAGAASSGIASPTASASPAARAAAAASSTTATAAYAEPAPRTVSGYADDVIDLPELDKYDDGSSNSALLRENRELRRMLAEERQKVEDLRRAIHICTERK